MVSKCITSFDGTKIHYVMQRGPARSFLLFLHGWMHNHTVWKRELEFFKRRGMSTIAVDLRGHGESDKPDDLKDYSLDKFANDIRAVLVHEKIEKAIFVGHSFGGMISLEFYARFPQMVQAFVLIDTIYENPLKHLSFAKYFHLTPLTEHVLKFILKKEHLQKKHFPEVDFSKFKDHTDFFYWMLGVRESPLKSVLACLEEMIEFHREKVLHKIHVPTLIVEGEKDTITAVADVTKMAKLIKNAQLVILKGSGHDTNIQKSRILEKTIWKFLQQLA